MSPRFSGSMTAIITPFADGQIDRDALERLVEFQIDNGTTALVPCGSTGESATLTHDEHREVIQLVVQCARGRVPVIAGTGSNSTREAVSLTRAAGEVGADENRFWLVHCRSSALQGSCQVTDTVFALQA